LLYPSIGECYRYHYVLKKGCKGTENNYKPGFGIRVVNKIVYN
jgi:hypothetical protein